MKLQEMLQTSRFLQLKLVKLPANPFAPFACKPVKKACLKALEQPAVIKIRHQK